MSRLTDLLGELRKHNAQLSADLEAEITALTKQRSFGLVFERHQPEAVELPGLKPRRGSKVHILPPRGSKAKRDPRLWVVEGISGSGDNRTADLVQMHAEEPERTEAAASDLVVVAEFTEGIYPGLVETGRVERGGDKPYNTVINGENYHALEMLTYTHRHKIDAIYIDPPYNTGAKDWKYNNDYVDGNDAYRHSKWLAFMERRLRVAKELLNPEDSVLIVTIDEKEYLRLGLLLEQVFPEAAVQMVTVVINPNGVARGAELARVEEYVFFVFVGSAKAAQLEDTLLTRHAEEGKNGMATAKSSLSQRSKVRWEWLLRGGPGSDRKDSPGCFYPVYIDPEKRTIERIGDAVSPDVDASTIPEIDGLIRILPYAKGTGAEKRWRMTPQNLRELVSDGFAKVGAYDKAADRWTLLYLGRGQRERILRGEIIVTSRDERGVVVVEESGERSTRSSAKTVWNRQSHNAGEYGSRLIQKFMPERRFPYPKSLYAVEDTLRIAVQDKPNAVILDFFAGSGTTEHAVMRLNRQDGGRRQCISITNNEVSAEEQVKLRKQGLRPGDPEWEALGICDYITKPRIEAAITGLTPDGDPIKGDYKFTDEFPMSEGFEENAAFFTLTYESPLAVKHNRAFRQIAPLLWMRAGSEGRIIESLDERGWDLSEVYGVLERFDRSSEFLTALADSPGVRTVFLVTDDDAAYQMVCRDLPEHVAPVRLYSSYLLNFEINRGRY